ncbi:MAG: hypothetical protein K1X51_14715 [Rhodospirillaceae bacterium]|nr:hypothetical protein [Rhodospirillaceae bacterium]
MIGTKSFAMVAATGLSIVTAVSAQQTFPGTQTYKGTAPTTKNVQGTEPRHLADVLERGPMTFFISGPMGDGGNLGGLEGADRHCQQEASMHGLGAYAQGAEKKVWRAYLSTQGANAINARDRIGTGPWYNC